MPIRQRKFAGIPPLSRFHAIRLRSALLEVSGPLKARPEPVDTWDKLGGSDAELRSFWLDQPVLMCRAALAAAKEQGPDVFDRVTRLVERFYMELLAASMHGFECRPAADLQREILDLQREIGEAVGVAAMAAYDESESSIEALRTQALDVITEAKDVVSIASTRLTTRRTARLVRT